MRADPEHAEPLDDDPSRLPEAVRRAVAVLAAAITLTSLAWAADLYRLAGWSFYDEQALAAILTQCLVLVFVTLPSRRGHAKARVPAHDWFLAAVSLAAGGYLTYAYPTLIQHLIPLRLDALIVSSIMFAVVLEGLRRTLGLTLLIVIAAICAYGLVGHLIPGSLQTARVDPGGLVTYLGIDTNGMLGPALGIGATVVIGFVFFGQLLFKSGGAAFFNDVALALMGRFRGGSAKISITASSLFGSISGVVVSNIVATGVITIPMMKRGGYSRESAAAIEAVSSTGGQFMPPVMGAVAFLMAEFLRVPYSEVVLAAIVPAVLYYVALFIQADLEAVKHGIRRVDEADIPRLRSVLRAGWFFVVPFAVVVISLFSFGQQPETAALYGSLTVIAGGLLLGYGGRRMPLSAIWHALTGTGRNVLDIIMIAAAAGFIIGVLNRTGLGFGLTYTLVQFGDGSLIALLVLAAVMCIVLGMGMPTVGVYLLLAVLIAPSLEEVGIPPMASHLFIFYFGMLSMVTPPLAIASFFAASIAKANPMRTAFASMRFGWTAYVVPFLFVFSPSLLMVGSAVDIAQAITTAVAGVWLVSVGAIGHLNAPVGWPLRLGFVISGLMMLVPKGMFAGAWWTDAVGLALGAGITALAVARGRTVRPA